MSQNGVYKIDVNNIRPEGNKLGSGVYINNENAVKRESFYAVRGTGGGSVCVYDKVHYQLSANTLTINDIDPAGATFNASNYITVNQRKHGNNVYDYNLPLSNPTLTISPNTSPNEQSGTWTITQFDNSSEFNDYVGDSVSITWRQKGDYVTGSSYTISGAKSSSANIPVLGGSDIRTVTVSCKRTDYYKSGCVVEGISDSFKVASLSNLTLDHTTAETLADGTVLNVSFGGNKHTTDSRTCSFDIVCERDSSVKATISWSQNADSSSIVNYEYKTTLAASPSGNVNVTGGTKTISVDLLRTITYQWASDGATYKVSDREGSTDLSATGCTLSKTTGVVHGESVTGTVASNIHTTSTKTITVTANTGGGSVSFIQNADSDRETGVTRTTTFVTNNSDNIPAAGGSRTVTFTIENKHHYAWYSDNTWSRDVTDNTGTTTLSCTNCSSNVSTLSHNGSATITIGSNGFSQRTVSVSESLTSKSISWTQAASPVELTGITLESLAWAIDVPATGGTATSVNCTYKVIAHYNDGSTGDVTTSASVPGSTVVAASTNPDRHTAGTLTLHASYGGFTTADQNVPIYQEAAGAYLNASCNNTTPSSAQTTATLTVGSNVSWTASSSESWITITNPTGSGDATRTVTYEANTGTQRTATITVTTGGTGGGSPVNIQVTQSSGEVKPAPSINSVEITTTSYDPQISLSIRNALTHTLTCSFTTDGPGLPGTYSANGTRYMNVPSSWYPFNVTYWHGSTGFDEGDNLYIVNTVTNNYITAPKNGQAYTTTSGQSLAIREGDGIEIARLKPSPN